VGVGGFYEIILRKTTKQQKNMKNILSRITANPNICKGKPCIRDMRFTVVQLLELLASGMSFTEILDDYPSL
jgi:uncharacterized protein (DUF433 family)